MWAALPPMGSCTRDEGFACGGAGSCFHDGRCIGERLRAHSGRHARAGRLDLLSQPFFPPKPSCRHFGYQVHTEAPKVGGVDQLRDLLISDPTQVENFDCLGVVEPVMQQIYRAAPVQSATFANDDDLTYGAVALSSPAAARALFAKFSEQWKQCGGKTVVTHQQGSIFAQQITDVDVTGSPLTAAVLASSPDTTNPPNTWERALGLAADVIVDVNAPHDLGSPHSATGQSRRPDRQCHAGQSRQKVARAAHRLQ